MQKAPRPNPAIKAMRIDNLWRLLNLRYIRKNDAIKKRRTEYQSGWGKESVNKMPQQNEKAKGIAGKNFSSSRLSFLIFL